MLDKASFTALFCMGSDDAGAQAWFELCGFDAASLLVETQTPGVKRDELKAKSGATSKFKMGKSATLGLEKAVEQIGQLRKGLGKSLSIDEVGFCCHRKKLDR